MLSVIINKSKVNPNAELITAIDKLLAKYKEDDVPDELNKLVHFFGCEYLKYMKGRLENETV